MGLPDKQPVIALPLPVAEFPVAVEELAPGFVWFAEPGLGVVEFEAGALVLGVLWEFVPEVAGELVLGFDVCEFVPDGLLCVCAGAELEGVVLLGVVLCATTQLADSSSKENSVAFDFMAVSRLRCDLVT